MENNEKKYLIPAILFLLMALALGGLVGFTYYKLMQPIKAPDLSQKNLNEIVEWCGQLDSRYSCEIIYEKSKTVEKDKLISQSVNSGENIKDKILIIVSEGLIPEIEKIKIDRNTTLTDVKIWVRENKLTDVKYVNENSDIVPNGNIIRIEADEHIYEDTPITVYVSVNENEVIDQNTDGKIEIKAGTYVGNTVSTFEGKVNALGLKPYHNADRDDYSNTVEKGDIVWHGSGTYEKGETINYGISLGKKDGESIVIKAGTYLKLSESEIIAKAKELGLTPNHQESRDDYSDTVAKGYVVWHGSGTYEKGETFNYGLSKGKKDDQSGPVEITRNQFVNISASEFETKTKALNLQPYHDPSCDEYSDTVEKDKVVWHGYGTYEPNERIRYGLSLGKEGSGSIVVNANAYVNISESEFKSKTTALGLSPKHDNSCDTYSDTIAKGKIVWHGSGTYSNGETIRYGLSLGKNEQPTVNVGSYANQAESVLVSFLNTNGLVGSRSEAYSDTVAAGYIISNDTGLKHQGDTVNYIVSKGQEPVAEATLASFSDINNRCFVTGDYEKAAQNVRSFMANAGFTDVEIVFASSRDDGVGVLISIYVNGNRHTGLARYPVNSHIVVTICNAQDNG